ncbi:MAG: WD40 repeat domain-containing protein [Sandaracinaceae bacterium]|nr:WD40 repeat domain-containing protein [Sandaracinaceae bacterium]
MTHHRLLPCVLVLVGCASVHEPVVSDVPPDVIVVTTPRAETFPPLMTSFESCLLDGGELVEVASVDNDDVTEHGAMWTFAIAPDRRIAVASEDGSIKVWTLDGFIEELDPGAFLYGVEVVGAQVQDLAFLDAQIVAGDVQGVVSAWQDGFPRVVGGTNPDVGIVAVAVEPDQRWVAHADTSAGGNVMIRGMDDAVTFGPLPTELAEVSDLAFVEGRLVLAGRGELPGLELRDAADPTVTVASFSTDRSFSGITEVAASAAGETLAFVTLETVGVLDADLELRWITDGAHGHVPLSVAVADTGRALFTVGAEGRLRAWSGVDGAPLATVDVPDPVAVRVDRAGDLVVVGSRDGVLRAFSCR